MNIIKEKKLTGERALFKAKDVRIIDSVFDDGESPLKESRDIQLENDIFRWKYPLWYANNIEAENITLTDTARSGIWYTHHLKLEHSVIQAPKTFRRSSDIELVDVELTDAQETFWNCSGIRLSNVTAVGHYFAMNSRGIMANHFSLSGNYAFDGATDVEISHARLISKDAFWNCKNVVVRDSTIIGEYLGWNSENVTFINCVIESNQGLCYMENVKLIDCKLLNTDLAFEYSTVEAEIHSSILSIKNPSAGTIQATSIEDMIFDDPAVDPDHTVITLSEEGIHEF